MLTAAGVTYYLMLASVATLTAFVPIYGLFNNRATVLDVPDWHRPLWRARHHPQSAHPHYQRE